VSHQHWSECGPQTAVYQSKIGIQVYESKITNDVEGIQRWSSKQQCTNIEIWHKWGPAKAIEGATASLKHAEIVGQVR